MRLNRLELHLSATRFSIFPYAEAPEMEVKKPQAPTAPPRLTQEQLDRVIERHQMFRTGKVGGARAALANFVLSGLDFSGQNLTGADFTGANLQGANLHGANLEGAT